MRSPFPRVNHANIFAVDRDAAHAHSAQHDLSADTFPAGYEARHRVSKHGRLGLFLPRPPLASASFTA